MQLETEVLAHRVVPLGARSSNNLVSPYAMIVASGNCLGIDEGDACLRADARFQAKAQWLECCGHQSGKRPFSELAGLSRK